MLPAFQMGADVVIAVDITAGLNEAPKYNRGVDIMVRANTIKDSTFVGFLRRMADVVIEPATKRIHWADFGAYERCFTAGEEAAEKMLPRIRQLLRHERVLSVLRPGTAKKMAEFHLHSGDYTLHFE